MSCPENKPEFETDAWIAQLEFALSKPSDQELGYLGMSGPESKHAVTTINIGLGQCHVPCGMECSEI